jgi:hypothetical protein
VGRVNLLDARAWRRRASLTRHRIADAFAGYRFQRSRHRHLVRDDGPGGPVLVVLPEPAGFGRVLVELLRTEGLNSFTVLPLAGLDRAHLDAHVAVLLPPCRPSADQVALLTEWVERGGALVAFQPDAALAPLLGLGGPEGSIVDPYLRVDPTCDAGRGITGRPLQVHGSATCFVAREAEVVAELVAVDGESTGFPAVSIRRGEGGGGAAAFAFDLARSVVLTRQGNPAWEGHNRDGDLLVRSNDLFVGGDEPDWVDRELLDVPQADEQQRLLVAVLDALTAPRCPLPRFWYLPDGLRAAIVMTGDDHALDGTEVRFREFATLEAENDGRWSSVRASSYVYPSASIDVAEAKALMAQGFEISVHVTTGCSPYTTGSLARAYRRQLQAFRLRFPGLPAPATHRTHCIAWSDWATQAEIEASCGIRLDTNYYFYPSSWVDDRPGLFTGSALPMRFASMNGEVIDCYQAVTQMNDETRQTYPDTVETLLDRALAPGGHVAVLVANMHTDLEGSNGSDAVVAVARERGVPVISARQLLEWLDGREASRISGHEPIAGGVRFVIEPAPGSEGLHVVVPVPRGLRATSVHRDGETVTFEPSLPVGPPGAALIPARAGRYEVRWEQSDEPDDAAAVTAGRGSEAPVESIVHAGTGDFAAGEHAGTLLNPADGTVVLRPPHLLLPSDPDSPAGWDGGDDAWTAGCVRDGELVLRATTSVGVLDLSAELSGAGHQFGVRGGEGRAFFFVTDDGGLSAVARSDRGTARVPVPGTWDGAAHRFRIEWSSGMATFTLDGRAVAQLRMPLGGDVHPVLGTGRSPLRVRWAFVGPYPREGTYTSPVVAAGRDGTWGRAALTAPAETQTAARLSVRTGPTPTPDTGWSGWTALGPGGREVGTHDRYLQYRLHLTSQGYASPEVRAVRLERRGPKGPAAVTLERLA